jgi:hypothetical protein
MVPRRGAFVKRRIQGRDEAQRGRTQGEGAELPAGSGAEPRAKAGERRTGEEPERPQPLPCDCMRLEELIEEYTSQMNFRAREPTHAPATEQELKKEAAFWRQSNGQLSLAAYRQCIKLTGIRGDAIGKYPGDRVEIPYTHFVPPKKFTADGIAPYLSATESRKEYIDRRLLLERRRKLDPRGRKLDAALYYYDVYVEKAGAERWLKSLKQDKPGEAAKTRTWAAEPKIGKRNTPKLQVALDAVADVYDNKCPTNILREPRNDEIKKWALKRKLNPPSDRTIDRAFRHIRNSEPT